VVTYQNTGQEAFNDLKIKADFPDGFSFSNADPLAAQGNNIWYVGNLAAGQAGQVKINGTSREIGTSKKQQNFPSEKLDPTTRSFPMAKRRLR